MYLPGVPNATIALRDLETLTTVAMLRLPLRAPERRRLEQLTALHQAGVELCRAVGDHTRCALLHARGTYGPDNLAAETGALFSALSAYAGLVHQLAADYERFADRPVAPAELLLVPASDARADERPQPEVC